MCSSKQIKELAECNAIYEFEKTVNMYGKEYIRYYYNKLAELNGSINSTCNCQRNSNSKDNEPCCRCDSKASENDDTKNKVTSLEIIVRMIDNKPYYEVRYREVGKGDYSIGYSSYDLKIVLDYIDTYFEIVKNDRKTNADRIRNMSDEELAEFLAVHDLGLKGNDLPMLTDWLEWLRSEAE